jgi:hypothetical protein
MKLTLLLLLSSILNAQNEVPAELLQQDMKAAREHIERLETSVPNFVCNERIVSRMFSKEKLKKETRAEAVLTTTRVTRGNRVNFDETRAQMRINGRPTKATQISAPFVWDNGPAYGALHYIFASGTGAACMEHKLLGPVKLNGNDAVLIETSAIPDLRGNERCDALRSDSADRIWLDAKTLNVIRVESHNPPATITPDEELTLTVEYAPVTFDGAEYWLPSHFISRLDFPGSPRHLQYEAFFTDYHKYGAESTFHVDPDQ